MTSTPSPVDRALLALDKMRRRVGELEAAAREPIAVVGAACRLPRSIGSVAALWESLCRGEDAVTEVPPERWSPEVYSALDPSAPSERGRLYGAFLDTVEHFDPAAFGISRREAEHMDPQQRLFLEVSAEALEDAGVPTGGLAGSKTGVFVGVYNSDFRDLSLGDAASIDAHSVTGGCNAVVAGRVSYVLDLRGPSMSIDTACSSSLVAVHLASQSLRARESDLALVGGVNLMLAPTGTLLASKLFALSPDGRCKTFDASANGFVRGEGCGVVVLKRLSDALRDGDAIRAVIRGSAVNQDGRSAGLTAPNAKAQEAVIRAALASAGVAAEDVAYLEAHGSGTPLGDPLEMDALKAVYGAPRADGGRCAVGTVKTNLGHLEAAAGIAGLLKAIGCLEHGAIPPHLHLRTLSPRIQLEGTPLFVPRVGAEWPGRPGEVRRAAVSSFGVSGTNAHVIVEAAPPREPPRADTRDHLLILSARTAGALERLVVDTATALESPTAPPLAAWAATGAHRRDLHAERRAVVAPTTAAAAAALRAPSVERRARFGRRKVVFVFPGQGSQWLGMARGLAQEEPVFAQALAQADEAVRAVTGWSVLDELAAPESRSRIEETEFTQPILFSVQVALAAQWRAWGLHPDAVIGHSMGEVAAAHVAGALSLADAARVIAVRSELVKRRRGYGAMALVELDRAAAEQAVAPHAQALAVAAVNGPRTVLLSGARAALEALVRDLEARGTFARFVKVDYASHSPEMDGLLDELRARLAGVTPRAGQVPIYSTVTERVEDGARFDADYWAQNLRRPVQFAPALSRAEREGHELFVELSPHPVLLPAMEQTLEGRAPLVLASLRRDHDERRALLQAAAVMVEHGQPLALEVIEPRAPAVRTPRAPWDHQRVEVPRTVERGPRRGGHPLWGGPLALATGEQVFEAELSAERPAFLGEHRVQGAAVLPAAAYLELALLAGAGQGAGEVHVERLDLVSPLALPEAGTTPVQAVVAWSGGERGELTVASGRELSVHARGVVRLDARAASAPAPAPSLDVSGLLARASGQQSGADHQRAMSARQLGYGPTFRGVERLWLGAQEAVAEVGWPGRAREDGERYHFHPAVLDAALQVLAAALPGDTGTWIPSALGGVRAYGRPRAGEALWVHARVLATDGADDRRRRGALTVARRDGEVVLELAEVQLTRLDPPRARADRRELYYRLCWVSAALPEGARALRGRWLVAGRSALAPALAEALAARGAEVVVGEVPSEGTVGVIHVGALALPVEAEPTVASLRAAQQEVTAGVLALAQAAARLREPPRLVVVTHGAQSAVPGRGVGLAQAPLWGLVRSIAEELPELRATLLDVPADAADVALLADEVALGTEAQVRWCEGQRQVARLEPLGADAPRAPAAGRPYMLRADPAGTLDGLLWVEQVPAAPGPGQLALEVHAAGLNFLDVLSALGARPDVSSGVARGLGAECAGVVSAVGPGVRGWAVGDRVVCVADGTFASRVVVSAELVAAMPPHLSFEAAAALPIAYLTAWYGLVDRARLERGERVLVHAATGGVGLAALEIARLLGAEVLATAGSEAKRQRLAELGVSHRFDSRTGAFAEGVRAATGGAGVDVVLNCLTGPLMEQGLACLAPYGRFVEIAKKDIYADARVGLLPFRQNLAYYAVDLARMMVERPAQVGRLLREVMARVTAGELGPLPVTPYAAAEAPAALRWMAEARHTGKVVLRLAGPEPVIEAVGRPPTLRGSVLITGGLGGIGLELARWLADQGAEHLVLVGRRAPDAQASARLAALPSTTTWEAVALDVGDSAAVEACVAGLAARGLPVRTVICAAAVLEDGVLANQDAARLSRALRPKLDGAWNLHCAVPDAEAFVMLSSAASLLGSAAQAPYAAANAFLDALAEHRRALGRPALSISYGPWAEVGLAAADERRGRRFEAQGMGSLAPAAGLDALGALWASAGPAHVAVLPLDVRQWLDAHPRRASSGFWATLRAAIPAAASGSAAHSFVEVLRGAEPPARAALLVGHVQEQLGKVLRLPPQKIGAAATFGSLGLDSLTGLEVRNRLENSLGLRLPATLLWTQPTATLLADRLLGELGLSEPVSGALEVRRESPSARLEAPPAGDVSAEPPPAEALEQLSEEELTRQLAAELASLRGD